MKDTQDSSNLPTRTRRRAFTLKTIRAIAKLVSRQLTESEACRRLGIEPKQWFQFRSRSRNDDRYKAELETQDAEFFDMATKGIEDAGNGVGMRQKDWRALAWLASVKAPRRFSDSAVRTQAALEPPKPNPININLILTGLKEGYAKSPLEIQVMGKTKQLPETTGPDSASTAQAETQNSQ